MIANIESDMKNDRKMDKAIIKKIANSTSNFIIKNGKLEYYILGSGESYKAFNINKLITDNQYFQELYDQGYSWYREELEDNEHLYYTPFRYRQNYRN